MQPAVARQFVAISGTLFEADAARGTLAVVTSMTARGQDTDQSSQQNSKSS
jgi:hypothetical protein